jgi:biotin carboxylase
MQKTLLIISGGIEAADAARRAKELGYYVVVSDSDHLAPGYQFADSRLIADVFGAGETAAAAERFSRKIRKIDGVICVAVDAPLTAATVAQRLGLPGISLETARLSQDKLAMKQRFSERGVPVPWFVEVATPQALQRAVIERGRDLVIKPVDNRGSSGVQRVARVADLDKAFWVARSNSPSERVMVEQYLDGPHVSTESLIVNGVCYTPGFRDRNYEDLERHAPFLVENGGDLPSRLSDDVQAKIRNVVAAAAAALGVVNGTVTGDIVVQDGEPYVVELAARLSGGFFCTREIPLHTGIDFIAAAIRLALGEQVLPEELVPKHATSVVQRYAFSNAGEVVSIAGADEARQIAGVRDVILTAKPGDVIAAAGDARPSAAMVLTTGASHEEALRAANDALARIKISTR